MNLLVTEPLLNPAPLVRRKVACQISQVHFTGLVAPIGTSKVSARPATARYRYSLSCESRFQQIRISSVAESLSTASPRNKK